ncbi:methyl-accepting chemotaxis protein [Paenibacillus ginsengarvi]|nr:methyl-accepting chemotaxis protein [Paenibacillus ginsengarvi]
MRRVIKRLSAVSIRVKFFMLSVLILIGSFTIMGYQQAQNVTRLIQGEALEKARTDLQTGMFIIETKYPGPWQVKAGKLYKGETLMDGNEEIVDTIGRLTNGDTATLFLGDTRVATNVIADGKRAVGTKVSEAVAEKVLKQGEIYLGRANVVGHSYQAAYMPIKDPGGAIIGMWYVGAPDADERIRQIERDIIMKLATGGAILIVVALALYYLLTRPMLGRLQASARLLQTVAGGDLTAGEARVSSLDETGRLVQSVNRMTGSLRSVLTQVHEASLLVASSSQQLSVSIEQTNAATEQMNVAMQEVAAGAEKQLTGITHSAAAVSDVTRGMDQATEAIRNMAEGSAQASETAKFGTGVVSQNIGQMQLVQRTVEDAARALQLLEEKSQEIDQIVEAITQIANQTNLLALNAAIEAARAGEHGQGFAVVAGEVKKLAVQSGQSAEKVGELIGQVQADLRQAAAAMGKGTAVVREGLEQARQTGKAFEDIAGAVDEITAQSQEVSAIVEQVHASSHETKAMMEHIAELLKQSAANTQNVAASAEEQYASSEEISASAASLGEMAGQLRKLIGAFKM